MIKNLEELDKGEIQSRLQSMQGKNYDRVLKFLNNDHWQSQWGWVGPLALESDGVLSTTGMATIEEKFAFYNAILEITFRHLSGVLGETPHWQVTPERVMSVKPKKTEPPVSGEPTKPEVDKSKPTDKEMAIVEEVEAALTVWMDNKLKSFNEDFDPKDALTLFDPLSRYAISMLAFGRGVLRIFIPSAVDGNVSASTLKEALALIHFSAPSITQAGVLTDKNRQKQMGAYLYNDQDIDYLETTRVKDGVTYLKTTINNQSVESLHNMRGHLFIFESRCKPLITDSIVSLQKQLNMSLTMLGRNVVVSGSPPTFFLNAVLPGRTQVVNGREQYVADPVQTGPGTILSATGIPVKDPVTGATNYTTPSVFQGNPAPVATFTETDDHYYRLILGAAQQLHALISGDAAASGESRIQALADFENSLKLTAKEINSGIQWLLESALSLAAAIMGKEGAYDEFRATVQCNTHAGPVSTEMIRTLSDATDANFISHETGLSKMGVQDVESELQRIEMQKRHQMEEQQQMLGGQVGTALQGIMNKGKATNGTSASGNGDGQSVSNGRAAKAIA